MMGPLRQDGGPGAVEADHLILVRFSDGVIDLRETGPGRAMPDGEIEWRDLGHIADIFPGAASFDCWRGDQYRSVDAATRSFQKRVQENPQIAVDLLDCCEKAADTFRDTAQAFRVFGKPVAAEAMEIAERATREFIARAKGGGQ